MKIMLIANYVIFNSEGGNSRFTYLLDKLDCKKNEVELITSDFFHNEKNHRTNINETTPYKITLIHEPGYKKNITLKRFYSHYILANNLKKYLKNVKDKPDVIYCAVPSLDLAKEAAKYAKKNNIRFIVDVQDLWPEAFKMIINIPVFSDLLFYPMKKTADYIYKQADEIIAVSETYSDRAAKVNKKFQNKASVFLGTDLSTFDIIKEQNKIEFKDEIIRIVYIGTLGASYDICSIIDAINLLEKEGNKKVKLMILGDGPLREKFENYASQKISNFEFTGKLAYEKMVGLLCACDIAINPIKKGSAASIINKVGDYAAAGLPVINTQESPEYQKLIDEYECGFNCKNGNYVDIAKKINVLIKNPTKMKKMGLNNRKLAVEKFDRQNTYKTIINIIEKQ